MEVRPKFVTDHQGTVFYTPEGTGRTMITVSSRPVLETSSAVRATGNKETVMEEGSKPPTMFRASPDTCLFSSIFRLATFWPDTSNNMINKQLTTKAIKPRIRLYPP